MAWAIISKAFEYHRPGRNVSFSVFASKIPQQLPKDLVDHAVSINAGRETKAPAKTAAPPSAGIKLRSKRRR